MLSRQDRKQKVILDRFQLLSRAVARLINGVSWLLVFLSLVIWMWVYRSSPFLELVSILQVAYLVVILYFILIAGAMQLQLLIVFTKNTLKVLFNGWLIALVLVSPMLDTMQTGYAILFGFISGYLDAIIEIHDWYRNRYGDAPEWMKSALLPRISTTISLISLLHMCVAYLSESVISRILLASM